MPTIGNMPHADVRVEFPDGEIRIVNMVVLLAETLNAEHRAKYGYFLPGLNRYNITLSKLRAKYQLPDESTRTWKDMALVLRYWYTDLTVQTAEIRAGR
jgi:hypothetical protein